MSRRMLIALLVPTLVCCSLGNGILPLLPLYALHVGATHTVAGWYTSFTFLCLAAGALVTGRLGALARSRTFLVLLTLPVAPLIVLMGRLNSVWQLVTVTVLVWFVAGCLGTGINITASRHAAAAERGRVFGLLGVAIGASPIIGGLAIGWLVDRWGYPSMFVVSGVYYLLVPAALMLLPRTAIEPVAVTADPRRSDAAVARIGSAALLFVLAQFVAFTANGAGQLGRSLLMNAGGFSASAVTSTSVVGALVVLPVPFVLGWLSDRVGRRAILIACYACGIGSLVLLTASRALWHFWIVGVLLAVLGISVGIGPAFVADLVPPARVGAAMPLFQAAYYLGSLAGMSVLVPTAGAIGMPWTLAAAAAVTAFGVVLILCVRQPRAAARPIAAVTPP